MKNYQCLMLKLKDQRKFFTHQENYSQLIEFSKVLEAEMSMVRVKEAVILELHELVPAICNSKEQPQVSYKTLKIKISKRKRKEIIQQANQIKAYIQNQFVSGKVVSLKELANLYKVTLACLCHHMTQIRTKLVLQGHVIVKISGGCYQIKQ